jgi:hypothetical protein
MLDEFDRRERLVITAPAFELASVPIVSSLSLRVVPPREAPPIAPAALRLTTDADRAAVGPAWEPKYRFTEVRTNPDRTVEVALSETSWPEGAGFHAALRRLATQPLTTHDELLHQYLRGQASLPGLASVHVMVVSSDRQVLMARRGRSSAYAGGRWSVSFEEQLTATDLRPVQMAPVNAARRGLEEELGDRVAPDTAAIRILALLLETAILNTSFVMLVELSQDHQEIARHWRNLHIDDPEIAEIRWLPAQPRPLRQVSREFGDSQLHPTSALRLELLARSLEAGA